MQQCTVYLIRTIGDKKKNPWVNKEVMKTSSLTQLNLSKKLKLLPSQFLVNGAAPISVALAFGPHSYARTVNVTVGGWPSGSTVCWGQSRKPPRWCPWRLTAKSDLDSFLLARNRFCNHFPSKHFWGKDSMKKALCFAPILFPKVLNAKQGNNMYHIFIKSLAWLDPVSNANLPPTKQSFYHWATGTW